MYSLSYKDVTSILNSLKLFKSVGAVMEWLELEINWWIFSGRKPELNY